jgi:sialic acid synthase SpsE
MIFVEGKAISHASPTYFIADIAANHDGDIERAKDLIYRAAESGADAAKFQHFRASTIVSNIGFENLDNNSSHQASWEKPVSEVFEDAEIDLEWTAQLVETCKDAGITFMTTPYDLELVEKLNQFVPAFKIGSGDLNWLEIVENVSTLHKPIFLATGASELGEVQQTMDIISKHNSQIVLMQCNTNYTGSDDNFKYINLKVLNTYSKLFPDVVLGLSDHTPGHSTVLGAVALGARVIEKHFTDSNDRIGPDHKFSMNPTSWACMVKSTRELENALGDGIKKVEFNEMESSVVQRRGIRAASRIKKGQIIQRQDLSVLRPCPKEALGADQIEKVVGTFAVKNFSVGDTISI